MAKSQYQRNGVMVAINGEKRWRAKYQRKAAAMSKAASVKCGGGGVKYRWLIMASHQRRA
jgi:hypothetical protein